MGTTPNYTLPYPEETDDADVPVDMSELATALAVSGSAVESLLFRARDGLRGKLRAAYGAITGASSRFPFRRP